MTLDFYDETFKTDLSNKVIKNGSGLNIGKIIGSINNIGLAIVSVVKLGKENYFRTKYLSQIYSRKRRGFPRKDW